MGESPLPIGEVWTPTLDEWDAHLGGGWDYWVAPGETFRVHVEMVDLEVPPDSVLSGFEIRLDDCRDGRPYETVARETLRNSRLALGVAELLAAEAEDYADAWSEGLAPRPEEVGDLE